jgi:hypothetical protein
MKTLFTTPEIYFCNKSTSAMETLFQPINGRTASGTFKKLKNQIRFFDLSGKLFASVVKNSIGEILLISTTKTEKGIFYSYALTSSDQKTLGIDKMTYSEEKQLGEKLWKTAAACS